MKTNLIVAVLLCIVTASQGAFAVAGSNRSGDEPVHLAMAGAAADNVDVALDPTRSSADEAVLVAMPFSSLRLSPSLVEYLGLTATQVKSIQRLMDQDRPKTEALMLELRAISGELGAAIQEGQNSENESAPQRLATTQARLLKQLMRSNSRLQQRINGVLDSRQRKKLDSFRRANEVTVGEGT